MGKRRYKGPSGKPTDKAQPNHPHAQPAQANKRKLSKKRHGPALVFDEASRQDFVGGFRRRKLARQRHGAELQRQAQREAKRQRVKERKEALYALRGQQNPALRHNLDSSDDDADGGGEDSGEDPFRNMEGAQRVFEGDDVTSIVTVTGLDGDFAPQAASSEGEEDEDEDSESSDLDASSDEDDDDDDDNEAGGGSSGQSALDMFAMLNKAVSGAGKKKRRPVGISKWRF